MRDSDEGSLQVLEEERQETVEAINVQISQFTENYAEQTALTDLIDELNANIEDISDKLASIDREADEIREKITTINTELRRQNQELTSFAVVSRELNEEISSLTMRIDQQTAEIQQSIAEAEKFGEPIRTDRHLPAIERDIKKLQDLVAKNSKVSHDYDQVNRELTDLEAELETSKQNHQINTELLNSFKLGIDNRMTNWEIFRKEIQDRSSAEFYQALQARGFRGNLEYNNNQMSLHINVHIDQIESDDENLSRRDIKQLSGGEKSYGTTCFLLSLWDTIASPIRCLDEFDVYMVSLKLEEVSND